MYVYFNYVFRAPRRTSSSLVGYQQGPCAFASIESPRSTDASTALLRSLCRGTICCLPPAGRSRPSAQDLPSSADAFSDVPIVTLTLATRHARAVLAVGS